MRALTLFASLLVGVLLLSDTAHTERSTTPKPVELSIVNPPGLYDPAPNGYSHAIVVDGRAHTAWIAGQGGEYADGSLPADFEAQVRQAYKNLATALEAVGASPRQVVKLTTYVVDHDEAKLAIMTEALRHRFGDFLPAQTLVPVPRLALDGMQFEVDAVAVLER